MQRTRLSNQFVYRSPLWLGTYLTSIAWATQRFEPWVRGDWGRWMFLCCAISALYLVGVDYFTYSHYENKTKSAFNRDEFLQNPVQYMSNVQNHCWVAIYNEGLVGCVVLTTCDTTASVVHWYVRARYREKGLGQDLMNEALQESRNANCAALNLWTSTINKRANKTLETSGFRKSQFRKETNFFWRLFGIRDIEWTLNLRTKQDSVPK